MSLEHEISRTLSNVKRLERIGQILDRLEHNYILMSDDNQRLRQVIKSLIEHGNHMADTVERDAPKDRSHLYTYFWRKAVRDHTHHEAKAAGGVPEGEPSPG